MAVRAAVPPGWLSAPSLAALNFSEPALVYARGAQDGHPKYLINPIVTLASGALLALPVASWADGGAVGHAGLLFSTDHGATWTSTAAGMAALTAPNSGDLEPACAHVPAAGANATYVTLRTRSASGMYEASSIDSVNWPNAIPLDLPSDDCKTNLATASDGALLLTHNVGDRRHLVVCRSYGSLTDKRSWSTVVVLADGADGLNRCYPTTIAMPGPGPTTYLTSYTVYPDTGPRAGIAVSAFTLP